MAKRISKAERRHQDALRLSSMKISGAYQSRLEKLRRRELRRVLALCKDFRDPGQIAGTIELELSEGTYLPEWWSGLWITAGVPVAKVTASTLAQAKAAAEEGIWTATLRHYALQRAGREIMTVTNTWKNSLIELLAQILLEDIGNQGVEKVTKELYERYTGQLERWMCRRIAQTETMIGTADAAEISARQLDVAFTKQWCISGLGNTRETHEVMDGVTVDQDEYFELVDCLMRYPHDTSLNPPAGEIINCACSCIRRPK